ncbi:MAG TPA: hypothetical protein VK989_06280, partial [Polyangia bacterium]|nr:hypothetical protein [Polyangia bacterium]
MTGRHSTLESPAGGPAARLAARLAARKAHALSRPTAAARRYNIHLRRFAGPAVYAETLDHLRIAHLTDQHV